MEERFTRSIFIEDPEIIARIFGGEDGNLAIMEKELKVSIVNRDAEIKVSGERENVECAVGVLRYLQKTAALSEYLPEQSVIYAVTMFRDGHGGQMDDFSQDCICITPKGKPIRAKTVGQKQYVKAIETNTICFGVGPAGTGKTFLAVALAVNALRKREFSRIVLTRPAVEAGEKLGFLPGDLQNKIDPYLRPLYDSLYETLGAESFQRHLEKGTIEVAPLAYMRGRTLDDSFIILDEAQNTTPEQMKMFLTRLGFNAKAVVTGDITQIDLPEGKKSGLKQALRIVAGIDGIAVVRLSAKDVVRHSLVTKIIEAYEKHGGKTEPSGNRFRVKR